MHPRNVLRVNTVEETAAYRNAVAEILRLVQTDHEVTLLEISERVDVSLGTVSNAANKKTDLNPIYLKRLGEAYGPQTLDPYLKLFGARAEAIQPRTQRDVLPFLNRAALRIAEARDPASRGGVRELLQERLGYLSDLRAVVREASALICEIESERDAA